MKNQTSFVRVLHQAGSRGFVVFAMVLAAAAFVSCSASSRGQAARLDDGIDLSDENLALYEKQRWSEGSNIPNAVEGGVFQDIYFEYDSSLVREDAHEKIRQSAEALKSDPTLQVEVEGHCDKRGTSEYNLALGAQRARSVQNLLLQYGVQANQISTVSYGEEIPIDPTDSEAAYAKNRRVHFAVYRLKQ